MTTEEMNTLDRQVAELMGIEMAYEDVEGRLVMAHDEIMYWQPTRDPRCERIVVEWARSQSYLVTFAFCANGDCVVGIRNACGKRAGASSVPPDTPGIALCLAVVEAFGKGAIA